MRIDDDEYEPEEERREGAAVQGGMGPGAVTGVKEESESPPICLSARGSASECGGYGGSGGQGGAAVEGGGVSNAKQKYLSGGGEMGHETLGKSRGNAGDGEEDECRVRSGVQV